MLGRIFLLAFIVGLAAWAFAWPAVTARAQLLYRKALGERPEVSWAQTAVALAPIASRPSIRAALRTIVKSLDAAAVSSQPWSGRLDAPAGPPGEFMLQSLFQGPTASLRMLDVHVSILPAGLTSHPPHRHQEEELIIPIDGMVEIMRGDSAAAPLTTSPPIGPGFVVYHPSDAPHTIRATHDGPARYVVFKWRAEPNNDRETMLGQGVYDFRTAQSALAAAGREFGSDLVVESPTLFLKRLQVHVSRAAPQAGYPDERDPYDIALVLFSGSVVTRGEKIAAPAVVFHPADQPHDLLGSGSRAALYVVIEFHGHAEFDPS